MFFSTSFCMHVRAHRAHAHTHTRTHIHAHALTHTLTWALMNLQARPTDVHHWGPWDSDENIFHLAQLGIKHPLGPT